MGGGITIEQAKKGQREDAITFEQSKGATVDQKKGGNDTKG